MRREIVAELQVGRVFVRTVKVTWVGQAPPRAWFDPDRTERTKYLTEIYAEGRSLDMPSKSLQAAAENATKWALTMMAQTLSPVT